ncbi:hypothetical protein RAHE111665_17405 [Rariglobus hedericola]
MAVFLFVPADDTGGEDRDDDERPDEFLAADGFFVGIGIVEVTLGAVGEDGAFGELGAERNVDLHASVDGPAVGFEDGADVALTELQPRDEHRRAGDDCNEADEDERELPESEFGEPGGDGAEGTTNRADGDAHRGDGADVHFLGLGLGTGGLFVGVGGGLGGGGELGVALGIGGCGALGDLLLDHTHEFFIRGEERLTDADGVVGDAGDGGIPVAALTVVEDAVATDEEVIAVAVGEAGGDLDGGFTGAFAVHVGDEGFAHRGKGRRSGNLDAELGAACIEIERAGLEVGVVVRREELEEVDEIIEQRAEVAREAEEFFDRCDGDEFGIEGFVLRDECEECGFLVGGEEGFDALEAELLDRAATFGTGPGFEGGDFGFEGGPVGFSEAGLGGTEHGCDGGGVKRHEGGGPSGVDGGEQRERLVGRDARQGEASDFLGGDGEVLRGESEVFGLGAIERGEGAGVVGGEAGAREIIVHLGAHGLDGGEGGGGIGAESEDVGGGAFFGPRGEGGEVGVKGGDAGFVDTGGTGAIGGAADGADDVCDEELESFVGGGVGSDDSIAIERRGREDAGGIGGLGEGDLGGLGLAEIRENAFGGDEGGLAFRGGGFESGEGQGVFAAQENAEVFEMQGGPIDGGEQLGDADAPVFIGVDER